MVVIKRKSSLYLLILMLNALNVHANNDYRPPLQPVTFDVSYGCDRYVNHEKHTFALGLTPYRGGMETPITSRNTSTKVVFVDRSTGNPGNVSVNMPCKSQFDCHAWVPPWDNKYRFIMNIDQIIIDESHIPAHIKSQMYDKGNSGRDSTLSLKISNGQICTATYVGGLTPPPTPPVKPPVVHVNSSSNTIDFGSMIIGSRFKTINSTINISVSHAPLPTGGTLYLTMNDSSLSRCGITLESPSTGGLLKNGQHIPIGAIGVNKTKIIKIMWSADPRNIGAPVAKQCSEQVFFTLKLP